MAATVVTAKPPAPAKAPAKAPVVNPLAMYGLTPASLRAMVSAEVASQLNPQRTALKQAQATTDAQYAQREKAVKDLSTGYAQLLAGIGPEVSDAYTNAGNAIADYAKGYSGTIQAALDNAGAAEKGLLGTAGAPQGQVDAALGHLAAPTDALYGAHGALPGGALATEGAAFTAAADELPGMATGRGQQTDAMLRGAQGLEDQKYQQDLSKLLASIPTLRAGAENSILKNARSDLATQLLMQRYGLQSRTEIGNLTGVDPATGQPTYRASAAAAKVAAAQAKTHEAAIGRRNRATASLLTKLGTWVYQQRHKSGDVVIGHEPTERQTKDAAGLAQTEFLTPTGWVVAPSPPANTVMKPIYQRGEIPPPLYRTMAAYVRGQLVNGLKAYGYPPQQIDEMVTELIGPPPQVTVTLRRGGQSFQTGNENAPSYGP